MKFSLEQICRIVNILKKRNEWVSDLERFENSILSNLVVSRYSELCDSYVKFISFEKSDKDYFISKCKEKIKEYNKLLIEHGIEIDVDNMKEFQLYEF